MLTIQRCLLNFSRHNDVCTVYIKKNSHLVYNISLHFCWNISTYDIQIIHKRFHLIYFGNLILQPGVGYILSDLTFVCEWWCRWEKLSTWCYPAEPQLPTAHPLVWQIPDVHEEEELTAYVKEVFLEAEVFIVDISQFPCLHQQFNFHVEKVFQVPDY